MLMSTLPSTFELPQCARII